jgi:hypothetical protein
MIKSHAWGGITIQIIFGTLSKTIKNGNETGSWWCMPVILTGRVVQVVESLPSNLNVNAFNT